MVYSKTKKKINMISADGILELFQHLTPSPKITACFDLVTRLFTHFNEEVHVVYKYIDQQFVEKHHISVIEISNVHWIALKSVFILLGYRYTHYVSSRCDDAKTYAELKGNIIFLAKQDTTVRDNSYFINYQDMKNFIMGCNHYNHEIRCFVFEHLCPQFCVFLNQEKLKAIVSLVNNESIDNDAFEKCAHLENITNTHLELEHCKREIGILENRMEYLKEEMKKATEMHHSLKSYAVELEKKCNRAVELVVPDVSEYPDLQNIIKVWYRFEDGRKIFNVKRAQNRRIEHVDSIVEAYRKFRERGVTVCSSTV